MTGFVYNRNYLNIHGKNKKDRPHLHFKKDDLAEKKQASIQANISLIIVLLSK